MPYTQCNGDWSIRIASTHPLVQLCTLFSWPWTLHYYPGVAPGSLDKDDLGRQGNQKHRVAETSVPETELEEHLQWPDL